MDSFINKRKAQTSNKPLPNRDSKEAFPSTPFVQSVKDGLATGIGVNFGERIVNSIFGAKKVEVANTGYRISEDYFNCEQIKLHYLKQVENGSVSEELEREYNKCLK